MEYQPAAGRWRGPARAAAGLLFLTAMPGAELTRGFPMGRGRFVGRRSRDTHSLWGSMFRLGPLVCLGSIGFGCRRRSERPLCRRTARRQWREVVALTFLVLLLCAAMVANVSDGPMREYRGSWVTHASR